MYIVYCVHNNKYTAEPRARRGYTLRYDQIAQHARVYRLSSREHNVFDKIYDFTFSRYALRLAQCLQLKRRTF